MLRARSRSRLDALEARVITARQERDRLKQELDGLKAAIRAAGQYTSGDGPDEREIAVVKIAAAVAAMPGPGWVPVPITVRGQQVVVLVCNCEEGDPGDVYDQARQLTRPLRAVATG